MAEVIAGSIPEEICYVYSNESEVTNAHGVKIKVFSSFPVDNSNKKMLERGEKWVKTSRNYYKKDIVAKFDAVENKPITNIKILSLECRGEGRAYKIVIDKYYVDLREDVLMDTILQTGIAPGGVLQGEYIWAKVGSQMKLILIGSKLYNSIVEFSSKNNIKPIVKNDLEIGGVYQDKRKNKAVFIGYVNTTVLLLKDDKQPFFNRKFTNFDFKLKPIKKGMLFYEIPYYYSFKKSIDSIKKYEDSEHNFKIKRSHTYIEKVDQVEIPDDLVFLLRQTCLDKIKNNILEYTGHKDPKNNYTRIDNYLLENNIEYYSEYLNLYPFDGKKVEVFDIKKYLIFS